MLLRTCTLVIVALTTSPFTGHSLAAAQGTFTAGDTVTIEDAQNMIVGTWTEDVSEEVGTFEKGAHVWTFTEDGTLRKYRDGNLVRTVEYEVTQQCEDKYMGNLEAAPTQVAMLKETHSDGSVLCEYIISIRKDGDGPPEPPSLLIGTRGGNIYFGKYSSEQ